MVIESDLLIFVIVVIVSSRSAFLRGRSCIKVSKLGNMERLGRGGQILKRRRKADFSCLSYPANFQQRRWNNPFRYPILTPKFV